ncbi:hypothetical protein ES708_07998 [subsurface metagenome]
MNLAKAIELNEEAEKSLRDHKFIDYADAVKLCGEAGKAVEKLRNFPFPDEIVRLPGETED